MKNKILVAKLTLIAAAMTFMPLNQASARGNLGITRGVGGGGGLGGGGGSFNRNNNANINRNDTANINRNINANSNVRVNQNVNVNRNVNVNSNVNVNNRYYHNGWDNDGNGAAFVAGAITGLAIGAIVAKPPTNYVPVYVGSTPYYYSSGVYYQSAPSGYVVVAPPVNAIVPELPPGSSATNVNGVTYFVFNSTYYLPVMVNGTTQYKVVNPS